MKYPIAIDKDQDSAYGVTVPDIPGCFSAGETVDEAIRNIELAIEAHLELLADEGQPAPAAKPMDAYFSDKNYKGCTWAYVDIDVSAFSGKSEKVNVTLPSILVRQIDEAVQAGQAKNRSAFLAEGAISKLLIHSKKDMVKKYKPRKSPQKTGASTSTSKHTA